MQLSFPESLLVPQLPYRQSRPSLGMSDLFGLLDLGSAGGVSLATLLRNLLLGAALATILAWHYRRFGRTFGNRTVMAQVFVLMLLVTEFAMTVVRQSPILALGLLGVLSITRFRAPIKEPEELGYLFFAIGIGLGLGADAVVITVATFGFILAVLSVRSVYGARPSAENFYVTVELSEKTSGNPAPVKDMAYPLDAVLATVEAHTRATDVRRLDARDGLLHLTFRVDCDDKRDVVELVRRLREAHPGAAVTFIEQRGSVGG